MSEETNSNIELSLASFGAIFSKLPPLFFQTLLVPITNMLVTSFIGSRDTISLAAFSLSLNTINSVQWISIFLLDGVTSSISAALSRKRTIEVKKRIKVGLITALILGGIMSIILSLLCPLIFLMGDVDDETKARGQPFFLIAAFNAPFYLVFCCCNGIFNGFRKVYFTLINQFIQSIIYIFGVLISVSIDVTRLYGVAIVYVCCFIFADIYGLSTIRIFIKKELEILEQDGMEEHEEKEREEDVDGRCQASDDMSVKDPSILEDIKQHNKQSQSDNTMTVIIMFFKESINLFIRAVFLQTAVFLSNILASRLGNDYMAAYQILFQLWMLVSYITDGFAVIGNMNGSRILGMIETMTSSQNRSVQSVADISTPIEEDAHLSHPTDSAALLESLSPSSTSIQRNMRLHYFSLSLKIIGCGVGIGVIALLVFLSASRWIISLFTNDEDVISCTLSAFNLIAIMQPFNGLCFVGDGLVYATGDFAFVRNIYIIAFLTSYIPFGIRLF
eukprot:gnl/Carplike_NY0171/9538_a13326_149.p1 GENE.gnl/Carplike_NY0171/9538_a13326_149~~gnl/Carplike_NY0171/9538_a13326_149.p1  ORF type:complete len:504 (-),score=71.61 gnl/Carplike_NY0171/9538_a13326_149:69-1580(-)